MHELPLAPEWTTDILGPDYQRKTYALGEDPDGEGAIFTTLVRHQPGGRIPPADAPAMLFVHGMSDYFFLTHVAEFLTANGWAVYGVDLRKCGRSWRQGQRWHHTSSLEHYYTDLTTVFDAITKCHSRVVVNGHSTGALTLVLWLDELRRTDPQRHERIAGVILNSPWFEMMYARPKVIVGTWLFNILGKLRPRALLHQDAISPYGRSLYRAELGEWDYNLAYKPLGGQPKNNEWLRAVLLSQRRIHRGAIDCGVPILVLCSTESWLSNSYSRFVQTADAVLDVHQIRRWARAIGSDVTLEAIPGAMHDVYLSQTEPRAAALRLTQTWGRLRMDTENFISKQE